MATITNTNWITLTDLFKTIGPDMKVQAVVQLLLQANPILQDMVWTEANGANFHQTNQQVTLPAHTRARLNQAIPATKGTTEQVTDVMEMLRAFCAIDLKLLKRNNANEAFRAIQDQSHVEGMSQGAATDIFYGNTNQDPEACLGLAARYSLASNSKYGGNQMINGLGDGAGAQTSIWWIDHAPDAVTGIYPVGTQAGLEFDDWGEQLLGDETNGFRTVVASEYTWEMGVSVVNPKHCVRICNVDVADMTAGTAINLPELMIEAEERMPELERGHRVCYMNRRARTALRKEARKEANVFTMLGWGEFMGHKVQTWNGTPIRRCDAILETETIVAGF